MMTILEGRAISPFVGQLTLQAYKVIRGLARVTGVGRWPLVRGRTIGAMLGPIVQRLEPLSVGDEPVVIRGHRMQLRHRAATTAAWSLTDTYEQGAADFVERSLDEGMTVVDGGANVGYYTLLAARRVGQTGRVYAFEPESSNFALLVKNVGLNGYRNVIPVKKALGARNGKASLHLRGSLEHSLYDHFFTSFGGSELVDVVTLDEFFANEGWPVVDLVKLDLVGGEPAAIEGMNSLLERSPRLRLVLAFDPPGLKRAGIDAAAFLRRLHAIGFDISVIDARSKLLPLRSTDGPSTWQNNSVNLLCQRDVTTK